MRTNERQRAKANIEAAYKQGRDDVLKEIEQNSFLELSSFDRTKIKRAIFEHVFQALKKEKH
jgi:hypothetical protein